MVLNKPRLRSLPLWLTVLAASCSGDSQHESHVAIDGQVHADAAGFDAQATRDARAHDSASRDASSASDGKASRDASVQFDAMHTPADATVMAQPPKPSFTREAAQTGKDRFGIRKLYPSVPSSTSWTSKWDDGVARTIGTGKRDARDVMFHNRGSNTSVAINGSGVATVYPSNTANPSVQRHYLWNTSGSSIWGDVEITVYVNRITEYESSSATGRSGFAMEFRTNNGHTSDPNRQCLGYAYAATARNYGKIGWGKELKHPLYSTVGGPKAINNGEIPKNKWIGYKIIVRDQGKGVRLQFFQDLTNGKNGGDWKKLLDDHDTGGWGREEALCGRPKDYIIKGKHPVILLRNDNARVQYKWMSIRTIEGNDDDRFTDASTVIFKDAINWMGTSSVTLGCNPPWGDWYCPRDNLSRAAMAVLLDSALRYPDTSSDYFSDDNGKWYEQAVNNIREAGLTKGCNPPDNDKFCPTSALTRAEMATFFKRALGLPNATKDYFTDDDGNVHEASINSLAAAGITAGCTPPHNDKFCPNDPVTRGQFAAFLRRGL